MNLDPPPSLIERALGIRNLHVTSLEEFNRNMSGFLRDDLPRYFAAPYRFLRTLWRHPVPTQVDFLEEDTIVSLGDEETMEEDNDDGRRLVTETPYSRRRVTGEPEVVSPLEDFEILERAPPLLIHPVLSSGSFPIRRLTVTRSSHLERGGSRMQSVSM